MKNIAIFGAAGAIGHSIAAELDRRGIPFRAVGRNRERLAKEYPQADCVAADLGNADAAEWAAGGVDTIFYTVGVPYPRFQLHPVLMRTTIDAAVKAKVERIVVVSGIYSYGEPRTPRVAETHPHEPVARKGRFRKQQEDVAMDAHRSGRLLTLVTYLPDFYGPHAESGRAHEIFDAASKGKRAPWLGPLDLPHEFLYVPDAGPALVDLAARDDSYGERWNIGGAGTITGREFITRVFEAFGRQPKWLRASKTMLRVMGLFNPLMRELVELYYLAETPVILDDAKIERHLGRLKKTPYSAGIDAWRAECGVPQPA